jgi:hypothetical protein
MSITKTIREIVGHDKFEAVRAALGMNPMPQTAAPAADDKTKCTDYPQDNGSVLSVSGDLVAGSSVTITTDNNTVPAPDGEYTITMPDGTEQVITVASGSITAVAPAAPDQPITPASTDAPPTTDMTALVEALKKAGVAMKSDLPDHSANLAALKADNKALRADLKKANETSQAMFGIIEKLAEMPAEESAAPVQSTFKKTKNDRLADIAAGIEKLKAAK